MSETVQKNKHNSNDAIVLIAGVAGLMGSRLAEALVSMDVQVVGLDSFKRGKDQNLVNLLKSELFELIEADVIDDLPETLRHQGITHIIDTTGVYPLVGHEEFSFSEVLGSSYGLRPLLDLANRMGARLIYTSSVYIYLGLASHESLRNYYDGPELSSFFTYLEAKRYGEVLCHEYVEKYNIDVRIARLPEVYGPRMDLASNSLLARMLRLSLDNKDLVIDEDGSREHQLVYVDDVVYGLVKMLFIENEKADASIFYLVNPERVSTLSIAYTLRSLINPGLQVEFVPKSRKVEIPSMTKVDISRAEKILKWDPKVELTEGLKKTVDWFKTGHLSEKEQWVSTVEQGRSEKLVNMEGGTVPEVDISDVDPEDVIEELRSRPETQDEQVEVDLEEEPTVEGNKDEKGWSAYKSKEQESIMDSFAKAGLQKDKDREKKEQSDGRRTIRLGPINLPVPKLRRVRKPLLSQPGFFSFPQFSFVQWLVVFLIISFFVLLPFFTTLGYLYRYSNALSDQEYTEASHYARQAASVFELYGVPAYLVGIGEDYQSWLGIIETASYGAQVIGDMDAVAVPLQSSWDKLQKSLGGQVLSPGQVRDLSGPATTNELESLIRKSKLEVPDLKADYSILKTELLQVDAEKLPGFIRDIVERLQELVWFFNPSVNALDRLLDEVPIVLGYEEPQVYVIWLQNNNELRSTGGFIGSYVEMTIENGQVTNFKLDDIYNPDGQLVEHENPPVPETLSTYLGVSYLGLRDSNWWPEFSRSAATFAELYQRATSVELSGVVTMNLEMIQDLLKLTGPVYVDLYGEEIASNNVFEKAQYYSEVGFEPGSTQKKDFLGNLSNALLVDLVNEGSLSSIEMTRFLLNSIAARDIMIYSKSFLTEAVYQDAGLSGGFLDVQNMFDEKNLFSTDYIRVIDNNLGGNKANYWVDRSQNYEVSVDRDGRLSGNLEVSWEHRGKSATWPNGEYKNYVRIYLPDGVGNVRVEPELTDQVILNEQGHVVVEGLVIVPIDSVKKIRLTYSLPIELSLKTANPYRLVWENQPGKDESVSFMMHLPSFLSSKDKLTATQFLERPIFIEIDVDGTEVMRN